MVLTHLWAALPNYAAPRKPEAAVRTGARDWKQTGVRLPAVAVEAGSSVIITFSAAAAVSESLRR